MTNHNDDSGANVAGVVGAVVGAAAGTGGVIGTVSAAGSVAGLSAAGMTSGLAAIGGTVGGGMLSAIAVTAAAPVAVAGVVGYGAYRLWKWFEAQ